MGEGLAERAAAEGEVYLSSISIIRVAYAAVVPPNARVVASQPSAPPAPPTEKGQQAAERVVFEMEERPDV